MYTPTRSLYKRRVLHSFTQEGLASSDSRDTPVVRFNLSDLLYENWKLNSALLPALYGVTFWFCVCSLKHGITFSFKEFINCVLWTAPHQLCVLTRRYTFRLAWCIIRLSKYLILSYWLTLLPFSLPEVPTCLLKYLLTLHPEVPITYWSTY